MLTSEKVINTYRTTKHCLVEYFDQKLTANEISETEKDIIKSNIRVYVDHLIDTLERFSGQRQLAQIYDVIQGMRLAALLKDYDFLTDINRRSFSSASFNPNYLRRAENALTELEETEEIPTAGEIIDRLGGFHNVDKETIVNPNFGDDIYENFSMNPTSAIQVQENNEPGSEGDFFQLEEDDEGDWEIIDYEAESDIGVDGYKHESSIVPSTSPVLHDMSIIYDSLPGRWEEWEVESNDLEMTVGRSNENITLNDQGSKIVIPKGSMLGKIDFMPSGRTQLAGETKSTPRGEAFVGYDALEALVKGAYALDQIIGQIENKSGKLPQIDYFKGQTNSRMAVAASRLGFRVVGFIGPEPIIHDDEARKRVKKERAAKVSQLLQFDGSVTVIGKYNDVKNAIEHFKRSGMMDKLIKRLERNTSPIFAS